MDVKELSLRDYFAAQALAGMSSNDKYAPIPSAAGTDAGVSAKRQRSR